MEFHPNGSLVIKSVDQTDEGFYRFVFQILTKWLVQSSYFVSSPILPRLRYVFSIFNCRCEVQNGVGELSKTIYLDVQGGC